jgi:uncharacterized protein (DUF4415 family)
MSKKTTMTTFQLDPANPPTLSPEVAKRLDAMTDADIDLSDIPELTPEFWSGVNSNLAEGKSQVTLRLDRDVLDFFRHTGKRYQTRINSVLRAYMRAHNGNAR